MSDIEDSEPELYGTSPRVIALFMAIVTFIVPFGYLPPSSAVFSFFSSSRIFGGTYGLLWVFGFADDFGFGYFGFHILKFGLTLITVILTIFNLLFTLEVVRFYQGKTSQKRVLLIGMVSFIYPNLFALTPLPLTIFGIIWPIPIQFIIGLIILYKIPGPEILPTSLE